MATITGDCPRCGVKHTTFDIRANNFSERDYVFSGTEWRKKMELDSICRGCNMGTILVAEIASYDCSKIDSLKVTDRLRDEKSSMSKCLKILGYISLKDRSREAPPEHIPDAVRAAYVEADTCLSTDCWNASAAMFRTCIDLATKSLLPKDNEDGLNHQKRNRLHDRLEWLFSTNRLPLSLKPLAACVKDIGNDGVHDCSLEAADAADLRDFTRVLLERVFTEPARVNLAIQRREERRRSGG
ncbi:DUF4145 domain-containing protein [Alloyangia pacifica]|uniref:DUF4145 domain-containing protein n=1 Tax=Alloyangia pacifica TaxID=311180 RepID=UPI0031DA4A4A